MTKHDIEQKIVDLNERCLKLEGNYMLLAEIYEENKLTRLANRIANASSIQWELISRCKEEIVGLQKQLQS